MAISYQSQTVSTGASASPVVGQSMSVTNTNPTYYFGWLTQSTTADFIDYFAPATPPETSGALSGVESVVGRCYENTTLVLTEANPNDSNNIWLHITNSGNFPSISWFNNTNSPRWGNSLGKGYVMFDWMYTGSYAAGRLLFQLNGKCPANAALDDGLTPYGRALYSKTIGGGSTPGIGIDTGSTLSIAFTSPAANTKYQVIYRWNRVTSNSSGARTLVLYLLQNDGAIRTSGWSSATVSEPKGPAYHQMQFGNDTASALEQWFTNVYVGNEWTYDLPVNVWQDYEFSGTFDATALGASVRSPNATTWTVVGTRWDTSTSQVQLSPSTINLWTDSGTRSARYDLNATTAANHGLVLGANIASGVSYGFWFRTATLSSGTSYRVSYCTQIIQNNDTVRVVQGNTGGQHYIILQRQDGTFSTAQFNVAADTWFWCAVYAQQSQPCLLQIYNTSGAIQTATDASTQITVMAGAHAIGNIRFGSQTTSTSQSAGTYAYIRNFMRDEGAAGTVFYPLKPWA